MVEPTSQNLYVMQSEFGLIKIGRSVNVKSRRINLQTSERCKMAIVAVYDGCGDIEEYLHVDMHDYRLAGEWFDGSEAAREALAQLMGASDPPIEWPYQYDREGAMQWLDHINVVRHAAAIRRELYREIAILRSAEKPSWVYDSGIFYAKWRAETGRRPGLASTKIDGETATHWFDAESDANGIVPAFTASTQNALLAWPDDLRPEQWIGSAIECCIAALTAIRARLPRVKRVNF